LRELCRWLAAGEEKVLETASEILIAEAGAGREARVHQRFIHAVTGLFLDLLYGTGVSNMFEIAACVAQANVGA
jgi:hypothetical protein